MKKLALLFIFCSVTTYANDDIRLEKATRIYDGMYSRDVEIAVADYFTRDYSDVIKSGKAEKNAKIQCVLDKLQPEATVSFFKKNAIKYISQEKDIDKIFQFAEDKKMRLAFEAMRPKLIEFINIHNTYFSSERGLLVVSDMLEEGYKVYFGGEKPLDKEKFDLQSKTLYLPGDAINHGLEGVFEQILTDCEMK